MPRVKKQHLKRRADGRYACRYGEKWFMGATEDEALRARERYKQAEKLGMLAALEPIPLADYTRQWLPLHKSNVTKNGYNRYSSLLEKGLQVIGNISLEALKPDDVVRMWQAYSDLSEYSIRCARMLFTAVMDSAIENDLCRKNPFRSKSAQPPKKPVGTHRALTEEEIRLVETTPHRFQPAAMIMLYAGLRRGEVAALTYEDIDLKANVIHVTKAARYDSDQATIVSPKTKAGKRDIPIFPPLRPFLENRIGHVLPTEAGGMATRSSLDRGWQSYIKALSNAAKHDVKIRMHDLRHTFATMIRDAGVDIHQAILWMGHANETMILRIYDHVGEERTKTAVSQVETMLESRHNGRQAENE